jgi:hypothetical protein
MLMLLAARLIWLGSALAVAAGFTLVVALAMTLNGRCPYVLDVLIYALQTTAAGARGIVHYVQSVGQHGPTLPRRSSWLNVGLPLAALVIFGTLFLLANPDLVTSFTETVERIWRFLCDSLEDFVPTWLEVLIWAVVAWVTIGLLRPIITRSLLASFSESTPPGANPFAPPAAALYPAIRNTLVTVILLFAVYLVFEFKTLWFRHFPKGFYYAGYAHEGAAWLTVALALATALLSASLRGQVLDDARLPQLRRLAWIWSAENLVLAAAVYNRMYIYVDFNGMTRMRTVGLFGISAVVVGFILVVWKIANRRHFVWLLHRHLWTVAMAAYLFALTPVDAMVHSYNVRRVLTGDLAPCVQISVHPLDAEGILVLHPLVRSRDAIIREGIRAMLAQRAIEAEALAQRREQQGWSAVQLADRLLLDHLHRVRKDWQVYRDPAKRTAALARFHQYVYQWY